MSPSFHDVSFPDVSTLRKPPFLRNSTSNGGQAARLSAKPSRGRIVITVSKSEAPRARIVILIMYQLSTRRLQLQHPSHYIWRCQLLVVVLFCFFPSHCFCQFLRPDQVRLVAARAIPGIDAPLPKGPVVMSLVTGMLECHFALLSLVRQNYPKLVSCG